MHPVSMHASSIYAYSVYSITVSAHIMKRHILRCHRRTDITYETFEVMCLERDAEGVRAQTLPHVTEAVGRPCEYSVTFAGMLNRA